MTPVSPIAASKGYYLFNQKNVGILAGEENVEFGLFARGLSKAVISALNLIGSSSNGGQLDRSQNVWILEAEIGARSCKMNRVRGSTLQFVSWPALMLFELL